jgi:hypothetical protein
VDGRDGVSPRLVINLSKQPQDVPTIRAAEGPPLANRVYVVETDGAGPSLPEGKKAVLTTDNGSLELVTRGAPIPGLRDRATYLDLSDFGKLPSTANPKLRRYRWRDTWRKALSWKGLRLLLTTAVGLLTAGAGVYFAIWGADPTTAATVSDRAQAGIEWVVAPADQLDQSTVAPAAEIHRRAVETARCVRRLGGREAPTAHVPGVLCDRKSPPWYRNNNTAAWVTLAAGLLTAVLAVFGLSNSFGFQKSLEAG